MTGAAPVLLDGILVLALIPSNYREDKQFVEECKKRKSAAEVVLLNMISIPLIGGIPAGPELLIILLVLVLLFGANKIPKLARSTGQAMGEFKKGREDIEKELKEIDDTNEAVEEETVEEVEK